VLAVTPYSGEQEAVAIANDSDYGLGGSVWTSDPERGASFARKVRSGTIGVNGYVNDPYAPFGGVKASGMGRELGPEGLQPFQVVKTIYLDQANDLPGGCSACHAPQSADCRCSSETLLFWVRPL
jgi:aldehyde dehydrogenase (NAD+)